MHAAPFFVVSPASAASAHPTSSRALLNCSIKKPCAHKVVKALVSSTRDKLGGTSSDDYKNSGKESLREREREREKRRQLLISKVK